MILGAVLAGLGLGVGLLVGWRALKPVPPDLETALRRLAEPGRSTLAPAAPHGPPWQERAGQQTLSWLTGVGLVDETALRRRLAIVDKTPQQHTFEKAALAIAGFGLPVLAAVALLAVAVAVPVGLVIVAAVGFGAFGFVYPDLALGDQIEARQQAFRHSLSAYLDLVTVVLAGGGGIETALHTAADAGDGWVFRELRTALSHARLARITPWEAFDRLGKELGIGELEELAASAHLSGDEGARIRTSLSRKADTMRTLQTAAVESQAEEATTRMVIPGVLMLVGLLLFIGYGAIDALTTPAVLP